MGYFFLGYLGWIIEIGEHSRERKREILGENLIIRIKIIIRIKKKGNFLEGNIINIIN